MFDKRLGGPLTVVSDERFDHQLSCKMSGWVGHKLVFDKRLGGPSIVVSDERLAGPLTIVPD